MIFIVLNGMLLEQLSSQCSISGLSSTVCINSPGMTFMATPVGGSFTGPGLSGSFFNPAVAGTGTHAITYSYCSSAYSLETVTFTQMPYSPSYISLGDNQMSAALPIGFTFRFYCNDYTSFYMSSNGFITFSPQQTDGCCQGMALPAVTAPANMIACAWTDLDPSQGGTLQYVTMGVAPYRSLLISYNCIFHKNGSGPVTTYILLYETTNLIEIRTVTKPVASGSLPYYTTMGIQNATGQAMVVPGRNASATWSAANETYQFIPGPDCSLTETIIVHPDPTLTATASKTMVCLNETITLFSTGAQNYSWSNAMSGHSIQVTPQSHTTYTVTGSNSYGCASAATVSLKVSNCAGIDFPNAGGRYLTVFPNPGHEGFCIQSSADASLCLVDQAGRLVQAIILSSENDHYKELKNLPAGIYLLTGTMEGNRIFKKVLIR